MKNAIVPWSVFPISFCLLTQPAFARDIRVSSSCSLADAITAANTDSAVGGCTAGSGADTIHLAGNITLDAKLPLVSSQISIEGNSHTIGGDYRFRIFRVSGGTLTLNKLSLTEGFAGLGGAIYNDGILRIVNSSFTRNAADGDGGGVIFNNGTLHISDSMFSENFTLQSDDRASAGSVIYNDQGELHIANSTFSRNWTSSYGGAIAVKGGEASIINCLFDSNSADWVGAAIENENGQIDITGSTFRDNTAMKNGGAISNHAGTLDIRNSNFTDNASAEGSGGAIYHVGNLNISDSSFVGNSADNRGGAIFNNSSQIHISSSTFTSNTTVGTGGAISSIEWDGDEPELSIINSTFQGNSATGDDRRFDGFGGAIVNSGVLSIASSSFTGNSATFEGGAIVNYEELIITNSTFSANHAEFGYGGGALYIYGDSESTLTHLTVTDNAAKEGGGILVTYDESKETVVNVRNSLISGNAGGDCLPGLRQNIGNLIADGSCAPAVSGDPVLGRLVEPEDGSPPYHPLVAGSLAIDAADPEFCSVSDQTGTARPRGTACDIGAYEYRSD